MKTAIIRNIAIALGLVITGTIQAQFVQEKKVGDDEKYLPYQEMQISVREAQSQDPLEADVRIKGLHPRNTVTFEAISDTLFEIKNYRMYSVSCVKKGYAYYTKKFWPDEEIVHLQKVNMYPLEVGIKTDIRDITFLGDRTEIYHKSKPALDELIEWLELNPDVKIAVIGHVNGPDQSRSKKFYRKASMERAQAVIDYLVDAGVSADRLEARGAGNGEMIYPDPITEWQNEANRRIEIEILDF